MPSAGGARSAFGARSRSVNKIGIHALVWAGSWSAQECAYAIAGSREAGYDLIEFPVFQPRSLDIGAITRSVAEHGLGVTCSLGLSFDNDINSSDPDSVARGEQLLNDALSAARDLGSPYLGGVIYSALGPYPHMPTDTGRRNSVEVIRRLAERAAASDITLGLECVNRYESNLLNTAAQTIEYIGEVGAPNVVVHLDSYHMNIEEADFHDPVFECGDRLGYVHIGENHRGYLGQGHVNFPEFFAALAKHGYDGTITFESFSSAVVDPDLSRTLRIWRNVWTDGMDLAKQARRYIGEQIETAAAVSA
jgi:D-psicose/D-tagatose/L-ribulose 3-epimerase